MGLRDNAHCCSGTVHERRPSTPISCSRGVFEGCSMKNSQYGRPNYRKGLMREDPGKHRAWSILLEPQLLTYRISSRYSPPRVKSGFFLSRLFAAI